MFKPQLARFNSGPGMSAEEREASSTRTIVLLEMAARGSSALPGQPVIDDVTEDSDV